jgi:hypothetical protein
MKFPSHTIRIIARLMLGLFLFAQGVVAANACNVFGAAEQAFAVKQSYSTKMHCHEETTSNSNVCLVHCTQGDQVNVNHVNPIFVAPSIVALVVNVPSLVPVPSLYFTSRIALNSGPPVSIRFCSYQI